MSLALIAILPLMKSNENIYETFTTSQEKISICCGQSEGKKAFGRTFSCELFVEKIEHKRCLTAFAYNLYQLRTLREVGAVNP